MLLRLTLTATLTLTAAACGPADLGDDRVRVEPVALFPDDPGRRAFGELRYAGGVVLSGGGEKFGGWSGIEVSPDGRRLLAISDSATWMTAQLTYDGAGDLTGVSGVRFSPILGEDGAALTGERADAEGLADLGDGRYAVSFEREHRIAVYPIGADWSGLADAQAEIFPAPPGADRLRANAGAEAMARIGETLWVAIEEPIINGQAHTLWRYDLAQLDTPPQSAALTITPGFGLSGLAPDGDGGLIVVERFWARGVGNRVKLGQIPANALDAAGPVTPEPLAAFEPNMTVDNFEAVALAEMNGERRLFVMSDDNFNNAQRTLLLSFIWPED